MALAEVARAVKEAFPDTWERLLDALRPIPLEIIVDGPLEDLSKMRGDPLQRVLIFTKIPSPNGFVLTKRWDATVREWNLIHYAMTGRNSK